MPYAAPRHCPRGHPAFTGSRCPLCARDAKAAADKRRPNAAERGYTSDWRNSRAEYLREHPTCVECGAPATVVDHSIPHKGNMVLFWDRTNWRSRCKACHDRKTAKFDGGFGRTRGGGSKDVRGAGDRSGDLARNLRETWFSELRSEELKR